MAKAYSAAGQATSALHAMAILQVHQAKALKQMHGGSTDPRARPQSARPASVTPIVPLVPLARYLGAWLSLPSPSRWLIRTIRLGYVIQFARQPPKFSGVLETSVAVQDAPVLREEIAVLLGKDAIEPVPPAKMRQGPSTNPGSASLESGPAQASVQDVDAEVHYQMHPAPGLVCSD